MWLWPGRKRPLLLWFSDVCAKLSKEVQEATGVQELQSDKEFIKQMVTASLPKSKQCTVGNELKRVCALDLLCVDVNCYKLLLTL
jgi:hypothetical protein